MNSHSTSQRVSKLHIEYANDGPGPIWREVDEVQGVHREDSMSRKKCEQVRLNYGNMMALVKRDAFKKTNESTATDPGRMQRGEGEILDSSDGEDSSVGSSSTSTSDIEETRTIHERARGANSNGVTQPALADIFDQVCASKEATSLPDPAEVARTSRGDHQPLDEVAALRQFLSTTTVFPGRNAREWCDINEATCVLRFRAKQNSNIE